MSSVRREYFRAPSEDGGVFIHPAAADLAAVVERNRRLLGAYAFSLAGRPVQEFRACARAELVADARRATERWGATAGAWDGRGPVVLTGHQPQPFHPGVWLKNFLAGGLARAVGGTAVNLVVDNDAAHGHVLRFPLCAASAGWGGGQADASAADGDDAVQLKELPLAPPAGGAAFEEEPAERLLLGAFDDAVRLVPPPCAEPLRRWAGQIAAAATVAASVGEALSIARRRVEESLGLRNLELPVSVLADGESFRFFAAWLIAEHERVYAAYNGALAEYRRAYRERSSAQPAADLARRGRDVEVPLWIWRAGCERRRLWVRGGGPSGGGRGREALRPAKLVLLAGDEVVAVLPAVGVQDVSAVASGLADLRRAGWKVRPRALTMTLFARLALGDVFIHGLGGALYDKVTDAMFERLWAVAPPQVVLASCTVRLPLAAYPETAEDLERARRRVRDWRFNADRLLGERMRNRPDVAALTEEKKRLLAEMRALPRGLRRRAYLRIHEINAALAGLDAAGASAARADLERIRLRLGYNAILRGREFAIWLHAPDELAAVYRRAVPSWEQGQ